MVNYQKKIKDMRTDNDKKQSEIAEVLNVTQSNYSKYERNERQLTIDQLAILCEYYNVSADYFLGFIDEPKPLPPKKRR